MSGPSAASALAIEQDLSVGDWKYFKLSDLFIITGSQVTPWVKITEYEPSAYPYVTEQATNNGVRGYFNHFTETGNVLVIESAVLGYCSYQAANFSAGDHVVKLIPRFDMNQWTALFLVTLLNREQYRFSYGRKAGQARLKQCIIRLPSKGDEPDYKFMENFMKSLPYSSNL